MARHKLHTSLNICIWSTVPISPPCLLSEWYRGNERINQKVHFQKLTRSLPLKPIKETWERMKLSKNSTFLRRSANHNCNLWQKVARLSTTSATRYNAAPSLMGCDWRESTTSNNCLAPASKLAISDQERLQGQLPLFSSRNVWNEPLRNNTNDDRS